MRGRPRRPPPRTQGKLGFRIALLTPSILPLVLPPLFHLYTGTARISPSRSSPRQGGSGSGRGQPYPRQSLSVATSPYALATRLIRWYSDGKANTLKTLQVSKLNYLVR